jgi:hypothetical protein
VGPDPLIELAGVEKVYKMGQVDFRPGDALRYA